MNFNIATKRNNKKPTNKTSNKPNSKVSINDINENLSYGLNNRNKDETTINRTKKKKISAFGEDDSSDGHDSDDQNNDGRRGVNRELINEQKALRKRAEDAMKLSRNENDNNSTSSSKLIYDYDGQYESFSSGHQLEQQKEKEKQEADARASQPPKKSRYVAKLLETSKRRQHEREIIMERKIAREQAEEDVNGEYAGKEKFVTSAYKRKLAEREEFAREEELKAKREEMEDVTKKKDGSAAIYAGFYGNFVKNEAMYAADTRKTLVDEKDDTVEKESHQSSVPSNPSSMPQYPPREEEIENSRPSNHKVNANEHDRFPDQTFFQNNGPDDDDDKSDVENDKLKKELEKQALHAKRIHKILAARERYFERIKLKTPLE